ncbi:hypothetical protein SAMN04487857_106178 [Pseudomonas sp. ok272]|uniref:hypothetical protein n=1 Tax=unclassified Pseudomonas TaxID=196821 RepID=UPI0008C327B3|nr:MULTISPECIES: hypothetical protein [unclassified Pseudomonas]SEM88840.1 hypothetical protein SAMN04487857_106178 [Pseudomonas sp. ok272]SFM74478.1 hypothetical protein SAMN04487858_10644 [Pseudomonas sp. ok602]
MTHEFVTRMNERESMAFINERFDESMAVLRQPISAYSSSSSAGIPDTDTLNAAVLNSTMVAFPEGMKRRHKRIIKRTFLFADLTAQIKYPHPKDAALRLDYMLKGLNAMGWAHLSKPTISEASSSTSVTMSNVVLDIIGAAIGGVGGTVGAAMKLGADAAIKGLKENKEALKLYEKNGKKADGSNFGVMSAAESKDDDVYLVVGAVHYTMASGNAHYAFFEHTTSSFSMVKGHGVFTMFAEEDFTPRKEAKADEFYATVHAALELEFGIRS